MTYLIDGFILLTKPGIKRYAIIPIIINMLLFVGLFFLFHHFIDQFNGWFETLLPAWLHWLHVLVWFIFITSFFLVFVYTFATLTNIIAAPFNSLLAEEVEYYLTGKRIVSKSIWANIKDIPRILGRQMAILGYYLPRALAILILFFIPLIQLVTPLLWLMFNAWFMSLTYLDYPTDNHQVPLKEVRAWMTRHKTSAYGFGLSVVIALMIPIVNLFVIPAAVCGATKWWHDEH